MTESKRLFVFAGAALGLGTASAALAEQPVNRDEVRAIVAEMLADAETRSSLLQGGGTAGYDRKFFLASANNDFRLNIGGQVQFRYTVNSRDDESTVNDFELGFSNRRTKLEFTGHVVNPNLQYKIVGNFTRNQELSLRTADGLIVSSGADSGSGNFKLEDAFFKYNFGGGFYLLGGQFKLPFAREELVSSKFSLAAERGPATEYFTQNRSQGIEFGYEADDFRAMVAFSDGFATENTDFAIAGGARGDANRNEPDYAFTGRFEIKFAGANWAQFEDFTSLQEDEFGVLFGAAAHFEQSDNTEVQADVDAQLFGYTADIQIEGGGFNLFGAFYGTNNNLRTGGSDGDFNDFGFAVQLGYRFLPETEIFGRYDGIFLDDEAIGGGVRQANGANITEDNLSYLTFGINQYFAGHAAKLTLDCLIALERTDELFGLTNRALGSGSPVSTATGLLPSTDDGQFAFRLQFQLLF